MTRPHSALCVDGDGHIECICGLDDKPVAEPLEGQLDLYDPDDREPMRGDPYWREDP